MLLAVPGIQPLVGTLNLIHGIAPWSNSLHALRTSSTIHARPLQLSPQTTSHKLNLHGPAGQLFRACSIRLSPATTNFPATILSAQAIISPLAFKRSYHARASPLPRSLAALRRAVPPPGARALSIGQLRLWGRTPRTPDPVTLWRLQRLEQDADAAPYDVSKQLLLYSALVEADVKATYDRVIRRWERMCELSPTTGLLQNDEAFRLYVLSLVKTDQKASVEPATRRRESLLAKHGVSTSQAPETSSPPPTESTSSAKPTPVDNVNATVSNVLSQSEHVARSVLGTAGNASTKPSSSNTGSSMYAATGSVYNMPAGSMYATPGSHASLFGSTAGGKENPMHVIMSEPEGSGFWRFLRFLTYVSVLAFFLMMLLSIFAENSGVLKAGQQVSEFEPTQGKAVRFSDVHGVDEAKEELQEVVEFLKNPQRFASLGGKLPKGVLLTGPPGTGKTLLARAVAGEAGVPFFFASGSEFDEMFVGVGAKRIRELFAAARKRGSAIIFIDELDAIGGKRSPRDQHYMKQTLNQLLVELDGFSQTDGVIVIAATNFPQSLDNALVRPGRFDRKVVVGLPDVRGRSQILKHHMRNIAKAPDVDCFVLARGTTGFSGADLENLVNQAAVYASRQGHKYVMRRDFEWARDKIIMGAERRSMYIDEKAKRLTAYHEGGHALMAIYTDGAMPLHKVTCMPRGPSLGHTSFLPEDDRFSMSKKEYRAQIDVSMGGRIAEEIVYGDDAMTSGSTSDLASATRIARAMVANFGFSDKVGPVFWRDHDATMSPAERMKIESEVRELLKSSEQRTRQILNDKSVELHRLADALMKYETLDQTEVKAVIKGEPIRQDEQQAREDSASASATATASPAAAVPA